MDSLLGELATRHPGRKLRLLDVGSRLADDSNRTYRTHAQKWGFDYSGLDVQAGINVDVVCEDPYRFPLADGSFDVVISGQVFEHIEYPWETIREVARVLRPGGCAIIIAPSSGPEHRYPQDCWRYYPDGMRALARWSALDCLHASTFWRETELFLWGDTVGIFAKPGGDPLLGGDFRPAVLEHRGYSGFRSALVGLVLAAVRLVNVFRWSQKS